MDHTSSSCSSSRMDAFPAGLRVLVVDDDPTWLKILEKMLRKCSYEVTTCCLARVALDMLRERRDRFDIVISDVNMPDMDGFKLLEHVGLEMDLPVIMMSVDGETSRVMKGVQHGACDYLLKPVRMKELRNIWQHVFRKKIHEIKEVESHDGSEEFQFLKGRFEELDERNMLYGSDFGTTRKRKDMDCRERFDPDFVDPSSVKKARVVWTVDLHKKFVNAVNQIGFEKVGPKKILDLMNIPGLTRENVASHLQKYRLYLSRLQKQNEGTQAGGATQLEAGGSKESVGNLSAKTAPRNSCSEKCGLSGKPSSHVQNRIPEACRDELKGVVIQSEDPRKACLLTEPQKAKTILQPGELMTPPPKGIIGQNIDYKLPNPTHDYWNEGISPLWFTQYPRQDQEPFSLLTDYHQHLRQTGKEHNLGDSHPSKPVPAHANTTFSDDQNESGSFQIKPECADYGSNHAINLDNDLVSVQVGNGVQDSRHLGAPLENSRSSDIKDQYAADLRLFESLESPQPKSNLGDGLVISSSPEDLLCSLQGYSCFENVGPNGAEILNYNNPNQLTDFQSNLYDGLQLDCEYLFELMKYPTIGGDLFA